MNKDKSIFIKNIYYMLSYAYKTLQLKGYEKIQMETFDNIHDLFAAILSKGITNQIKRGINREYIEQESPLSTVRGKIDMNGSMGLKIKNSNRIFCRFEELSENNYLNQIIKTTVLCLIASDNVKKENKDALKKVILFFSSVDTLNPSTINWNRLLFHRNNATYRMLMNICYLVLKGLLLTTDSGKHKLATFLDEQQMSRLYEKFILEYYKRHFPQYHPNSKQIKWDAEGTVDFLPVMQSDIMLTSGRRKLIIDAKYYTKTLQKQYDVRTVHSNNLYQIYTYVKNEDKKNSGMVSGMLLYAKTDETLVPDFNYVISGSQIIVKTLDLNMPFSNIKQQFNLIVERWNKTIEIKK